MSSFYRYAVFLYKYLNLSTYNFTYVFPVMYEWSPIFVFFLSCLLICLGDEGGFFLAVMFGTCTEIGDPIS